MHDELILHVGPPKTGTTSIQRSLLYAGSGPGWSYVMPGLPYGAFRLLNHGFSDAPQTISAAYTGGVSTPREAREWLVERIRCSPGPRAILSSESLSYLTDEQLELFLRHCAPTAKRVTAIGYFRPVYDRLASAFQQNLKSRDRPIDVVIPPRPHAFFWWTRRWDEALGRENVLLRPFQRAHFKGGSVLSDFSHTLSLGGQGAAPAHSDVAEKNGVAGVGAIVNGAMRFLKRARTNATHNASEPCDAMLGGLIDMPRSNESLGAEAVRFLKQMRRIQTTKSDSDFRVIGHLSDLGGPKFTFGNTFLRKAEPAAQATRNWAIERMGWDMGEELPPETERSVNSEADLNDILPSSLEWLGVKTGIAVSRLRNNHEEIGKAVIVLRDVPRDYTPPGGKKFRGRCGP